MHKSFTTAVNILAVGTLLLGSALAQQTPPRPLNRLRHLQLVQPRVQQGADSGDQAASHRKSATTLTLKTQKEKFSYALGMKTGQRMAESFTKQSVPFDPGILARGLKDGFIGTVRTLMTDEEAQAAITGGTGRSW